jgi:hypothetical protein
MNEPISYDDARADYASRRADDYLQSSGVVQRDPAEQGYGSPLGRAATEAQDLADFAAGGDAIQRKTAHGLQLAPAGRHASPDDSTADADELRDFLLRMMPDLAEDTGRMGRAMTMMNRAANRARDDAGKLRTAWEIAGAAGLIPVAENEKCLDCRRPFADESLIDITGDRKNPRRGDVSLCEHCASVTLFDLTRANTRLARRRPSADEATALAASDAVKSAQIAIRMRRATAGDPRVIQ